MHPLKLFMAGAALALAVAPGLGQSSPAVVAAKAAGQVGERYDGFLGYAVGPAPALRKQVESVNIRRRALYIGLASRRGASPQEVGITAGCELLSTVAVGEVYLLGDNVWRRRGAGESAPVPAYCGR